MIYVRGSIPVAGCAVYVSHVLSFVFVVIYIFSKFSSGAANVSISFQCSCGKRYAVHDELAGRRATCKACGAKITIPFVNVPPEPDSISDAGRPLNQKRNKIRHRQTAPKSSPRGPGGRRKFPAGVGDLFALLKSPRGVLAKSLAAGVVVPLVLGIVGALRSIITGETNGMLQIAVLAMSSVLAMLAAFVLSMFDYIQDCRSRRQTVHPLLSLLFTRSLFRMIGWSIVLGVGIVVVLVILVDESGRGLRSRRSSTSTAERLRDADSNSQSSSLSKHERYLQDLLSSQTLRIERAMQELERTDPADVSDDLRRRIVDALLNPILNDGPARRSLAVAPYVHWAGRRAIGPLSELLENQDASDIHDEIIESLEPFQDERLLRPLVRIVLRPGRDGDLAAKSLSRYGAAAEEMFLASRPQIESLNGERVLRLLAEIGSEPTLEFLDRLTKDARVSFFFGKEIADARRTIQRRLDSSP